MSAISSINFKKSNAIQTRHNDRDLPPNYLISDIGCEVNRNHREALKLRNKIIENAINAYNKNKSPKAPNFKAKSYEWSAVVNIKQDTTMQDLENLAKHFETKYGFQCYQIAIHRDEGYIDDDGKEVINHHAHLEFITLDKQTGKNMYRRELISPKILRQIQTEVAEILNMERGQDKRISKRERVEPRKYAQMKEAERKEQTKLKAEHKKELEAKDQEIQETTNIADDCIQELKEELEQEKLSKAELKKELEQLRKDSKNQGFGKEYFQEINKEKKLLRFKTIDDFKEWVQELKKKHTTKGILGDKVNEEAVLEDMYKGYQELEAQNQELKAKNEALTAENNEIKAQKKAEIEKMEAEIILTQEQIQEIINQALEKIQADLKEKEKEKIIQTQNQKISELQAKNSKISDQEQEQYQENMQNPNSYTTDDLLKAIDFKDDVSTLQTPNTDKTEVLEQDQEEDQTQNNDDDLGIDKIIKNTEKTEVKEQDQEQKNEVIQIQNQEQYQENTQTPNNEELTENNRKQAIHFLNNFFTDDVSVFDKTEVKEQNQEEDQEQNNNKSKTNIRRY